MPIHPATSARESPFCSRITRAVPWRSQARTLVSSMGSGGDDEITSVTSSNAVLVVTKAKV